MGTLNSLLAPRFAGLLLVFLLMGEPPVAAEPAAGTRDLADTIQYLLDFVKNSGCRFYRNNKVHTAAEAANHMQRKYEHFKDEIKTPEDFIRLTATKSLISGKPYHVESTTTRKAGCLDSRPEAEKTKARQCFNRCGCNPPSGGFENNQLTDGKKLTSEAWLRQALENYRQKKN